LRINDDNYLIELRNKNPKALRYVMEKYMKLLYGTGLQIIGSCGTREDVEECIQDSFIYSWNNIENYREERGSFKNWLMIICRSQCLNKRKTLLKDSNLIDISEVDVEDDQIIERVLIEKEDKQQVIKAIKDLSEIDREIFIRKYFFYEATDSICKSLSITRTAFDNRIYRGKKKIKELIKNYYKEVL
jgi:RNA polymerase sigma-70 factor (ECF subfamily)